MELVKITRNGDVITITKDPTKKVTIEVELPKGQNKYNSEIYQYKYLLEVTNKGTLFNNYHKKTRVQKTLMLLQDNKNMYYKSKITGGPLIDSNLVPFAHEIFHKYWKVIKHVDDYIEENFLKYELQPEKSDFYDPRKDVARL